MRARVVAIARLLWKGITTIWNAIASTTRRIFNYVRNWAVWLWGNLRARVVAVARLMWKGITNIWNAIASTTRRIFNYIKNWSIWLWNNIRIRVTTIARTLWKAITGVWNAIASVTRRLFTSIKNFLVWVWNLIRKTVTNVVRSMWNGIRGTWNILSRTTRNIFNGVRGSMVNIWNSIKNSVTGIASSLWGSVRKTFTNMKNGLKGLAGKIGDVINNMVKGIKTGLNSLIKGVNFVADKLGVDTKIKPLHTGTAGASNTGVGGGLSVSNGAVSSPGLAMVNDRGSGNGSGPNGHQEVIEKANGQMIAPKGRNVTVPLAKGDIVHNGRSVQRAQQAGMIPKFASGTGMGKDMLKKRKKKNHEHAFDAIGAFGPSGGGLKEGLADLVGIGAAKTKPAAKKIADIGQGAKAALGTAGSWAKDKAGDLLEWVGKPGKLLDKILSEFGVKFPKVKGQIPKDMMWDPMWKGLKNGARSLFDGWLTDAEGAGDGGYIDLSKGINFGYAPSAAKAAAMGYPFPRPHHGIDVNYKYGEKLYSTMAGTATGKSGYNGGFGNSMWIKNGPLQAIYGHMSKLNWTGNKKVKPGSYLGKVGSTGDSTGPQNIGVIIRQRILNNSLNSQGVRCAS